MKNRIFSWHPNDFIKGAVMFVFVAVLSFVSNLIAAHTFSFDVLTLRQIGTVSFEALVAYLGMKFLQSSPTPTTEAIAGIKLPAAVPTLPPTPETKVLVTGQISDIKETPIAHSEDS